MSQIEQMTPPEAYEALRGDATAALVDVRTKPEWSFVGIPDLRSTGNRMALAEWRSYPDMSVNPTFVEDVTAQLGGTLPDTILFICRSGARSDDAARAVSQTAEQAGISVRCINVAEGFEGDLDSDAHRGSMNGWKAHSLPWRQT